MKPHNILKDCADILAERGVQYGDPRPLYKITGRMLDVGDAEACLALAKIKLARIENGVDSAAVLKDSYIDAINYLALACYLELGGDE
jgi:hypothetical protein